MKLQRYFFLFLLLQVHFFFCSDEILIKTLCKVPVELWHKIVGIFPEKGMQTRIVLLLAQCNKGIYYQFLRHYLEKIATNRLRYNVFNQFHVDEFNNEELYPFLDQKNKEFLNEYYNDRREEFFLKYSNIFSYCKSLERVSLVKEELQKIILQHNLSILIDVLPIPIHGKEYEIIVLENKKDKKQVVILVPSLCLNENSWPLISFIENNYPICVRIIVKSIAKELCQNTEFISKNFKNKNTILQNNDGKTLLTLLYRYDCKELFFTCLNAGSNPEIRSKSGMNSIHEIIETQPDIWIKYSEDNFKEQEPESTKINHIEYLLRKGFDIQMTFTPPYLLYDPWTHLTYKDDDITYASYAAINKRYDVALFFINAGTSIADLLHTTLTHSLCYSEGVSKVFNLLLKDHRSNIDINEQYDCGDTLLHIARRKGYKEICNLLIQEGAREDIKNSAGKFPTLYR